MFGGGLVRALGMIPNEYLVYYYASREVVHALREAECVDCVALRPRDVYWSPGCKILI